MAYKWLKFTAVVGNESDNTRILPSPFSQKLLFRKNFVTFVIGSSLPLTLCESTETENYDAFFTDKPTFTKNATFDK